MSSRTTSDKPILDAKSNDALQVGSLSNEEMRRELTDSRLRINSLRIELRRAENDVYKVERLWNILLQESPSQNKYVKIAYLAISSIVPDIIKWLLRPLTKRLKRGFRGLDASGRAPPYEVRLTPAVVPRARVLHAIANFMTGGSSRLVVDIVEGLGHVYQQEILTGYIPVPLAYQGIAVRESRSPFEMVKILETFRPDVLHVHYWGDVDFGWYDKVFRAAEEVGCKIVENVNTPVAPYRSPNVRQYVYVSDYVRRDFGRSVEASLVIHPGSDLEFFTKNGASDVPENCIGMVYRLEPDKLTPQSIDVFIEVAKRKPNTRILVVGGGSFLNTFKKAALAQGIADSFVFTGAVPYEELPDLYAQMSVFVAPVWKESFGQVSTFAMSMGIPVVGYRVGGLEEIVDDDELLAPAGDSEYLANIIIRLLDDRKARRRIGERNRQRVYSLFSVEQMIEKYGTLYRNVIGGDK
ncbi:MAG: glycosyltransferase family 4 protein [Rhodocyclaceae bacterium]|nr:glycosyltransferase family 4 protein [Rhodocyclaceae bacterium]MCO5097916.1 glycosyltransferase family 4 protein [Rhodocyclaceae bacterium]